MPVRLLIDGAEVARLLRSPTGPVGRHLIERATQFQAAAKAQLEPHNKTKCLSDSIVKRLEAYGAGDLSVRVKAETMPCSPSRTEYSLMVHNGTAPHVITAVNADMLAFYWALGPDGPGMYYFKSVNHPGTAPIPFFTDNLPLFAV